MREWIGERAGRAIVELSNLLVQLFQPFFPPAINRLGPAVPLDLLSSLQPSIQHSASAFSALASSIKSKLIGASQTHSQRHAERQQKQLVNPRFETGRKCCISNSTIVTISLTTTKEYPCTLMISSIIQEEQRAFFILFTISLLKSFFRRLFDYLFGVVGSIFACLYLNAYTSSKMILYCHLQDFSEIHKVLSIVYVVRRLSLLVCFYLSSWIFEDFTPDTS